MDLAQLLAHLLRLMATHPAVVVEDGPSRWVQAAQVISPLVTAGAVVMAVMAYRRAGTHHLERLAEDEKARHRTAAAEALAEAVSALQVFLEASTALGWAEDHYPEVVRAVKEEWARGESRSPLVQLDLDRIGAARDTANEARTEARLKVTRSQLHFSPGDSVGVASIRAYDATDVWYYDVRYRDRPDSLSGESEPEPPCHSESEDLADAASLSVETPEQKSERRRREADDALGALKDEVATFVQSGRSDVAARERRGFWFPW